jgi:hypothetical protein
MELAIRIADWNWIIDRFKSNIRFAAAPSESNRHHRPTPARRRAAGRRGQGPKGKPVPGGHPVPACLLGTPSKSVRQASQAATTC